MSMLKKIKKKKTLISKQELEQIKEDIEFYRIKIEDITSKKIYTRKDIEDLLVYGRKFNKLKKRLEIGLELAKKEGI